MRGNKKLYVITACILTGLLATSVYAVRLLSLKTALQKMMPEATGVVEEKRKMTPAEKEEIKKRLGGILVFYQADSEAEREDVYESDEYTFHFGLVGDKKVAVAVVETQPGKWGPVEFIIALDATTAKVNNLAVMSYTERRGRPIARFNFLKQFLGKGSGDPLKVRKDIRGITGATISSVATCFAVKKVIALYEVMYLSEGQSP